MTLRYNLTIAMSSVLRGRHFIPAAVKNKMALLHQLLRKTSLHGNDRYYTMLQFVKGRMAHCPECSYSDGRVWGNHKSGTQITAFQA